MTTTDNALISPDAGLRTDAFDFDLPASAIATRPATPRHSARLLEVGERLTDRTVAELPGLFRAGDVLVVNDTRVIPARLTGRRGDARVEVTLHKRAGPNGWRAFARPAKRLRPGDEIIFAPGFAAMVADKGDGGEVELLFPEDLDLAGALKEHGAVAAPTAGLHFTPELLAETEARGVRLARVTLHVGAGTILPVKTELVRDHRMHAEWGRIDAATADVINVARADGGRVIAVGTTSLRLLESAATPAGDLAPFEDETSIFITPGYRFRIVDALLTNFHLPRSTLFMLVAAFAGLERMQAAYAHARDSGYRFYSYGDATLLHRNDGR